MKTKRRPKRKWTNFTARPKGSRLYREQAKAKVEEVLRGYEGRGVPRRAALKASLRELRERGAYFDGLGRHCMDYMEKLLAQESRPVTP